MTMAAVSKSTKNKTSNSSRRVTKPELVRAGPPLPPELLVKIGLNCRDVESLRAVCQSWRDQYTPQWKVLSKAVMALAYRGYKAADPAKTLDSNVVIITKSRAIDLAIDRLRNAGDVATQERCELSNSLPCNLDGVDPDERLLQAGRVFFKMRGLDLKPWKTMAKQLAGVSPHLLALLTKHPDARQLFWLPDVWKRVNAAATAALQKTFPTELDWKRLQQGLSAADQSKDKRQALIILRRALAGAVLFNPHDTTAVDFASESLTPAEYFGFATYCLSDLPESSWKPSGLKLAQDLAGMLADPNLKARPAGENTIAKAVELVSSWYNYTQTRFEETDQFCKQRHERMMPIARNIPAIVRSIPAEQREERRSVMKWLMGYLQTKDRHSFSILDQTAAKLMEETRKTAKEEQWLGKGASYFFDRLVL
jgi:hypothetical protein